MTPPEPGGVESADLQDLPKTRSQKRSFGWSNNHSNIDEGCFTASHRRTVFPSKNPADLASPASTFAEPVFSSLHLCRSGVSGLQLHRSTISSLNPSRSGTFHHEPELIQYFSA
ncbi:hypothetical protein ACOSQ3_031735 [Xanthoceras sorbifolium]